MSNEASEPRRKLTPEQVTSITELIREGKLSLREIAHNFGIGESLVRYYKRKAKLGQPAREAKTASVKLQLSELNSYVAILSDKYMTSVMQGDTSKVQAFRLNQLDRAIHTFLECRKSLIELGIDDETTAIYADDVVIGQLTNAMTPEQRLESIERLKRVQNKG